MNEWIDITRPMDRNLVCWPGRTPPEISWVKRLDRGDHCNVSSWQMSAHSGTHIDAPLHFIEGGMSIEQIPLDVLCGPCTVVRATQASPLQGVRRLLVKTDYPPSSGFEHHPALLSLDLARSLVQNGLVLLGTDRLSIDDSRGGFDLHRLILGANCIIIEGLDLSRVKPGQYDLLALPLAMNGAEASPARVLVRPTSSAPV